MKNRESEDDGWRGEQVLYLSNGNEERRVGRME
jgi:hypothetical protein